MQIQTKPYNLGTILKTIAAFLFLFISLVSSAVFAAKPTVLLGVPHWPPYTYDENEFIGGLDVELFVELGERIGFDLRLVSCPWKRCLKMVEVGQLDVVTSMLKTTERTLYLDYVSPPYYTSNKVFYVLKPQATEINHYDDLAKLLVGTTAGHSYDARFDSDESLNKVAMVNEASLVDMLLKRRIDTFVSEQRFADIVIQSKKLQEQVQKANFMFAGVEGYIGVSKQTKHTELYNALCQQISLMLVDGTLDKIFHRVALGDLKNYASLKLDVVKSE